MDYTKINDALARKFGKKQVEVRNSSGNKEYDCVLWFLSDNPSKQMIADAQRIVSLFENVSWMNDKAFHSD